MTAKQFWFKNFTGQSIFEVMNAFAEHREEELKKKLDDQLQTAEAKRIRAETMLKECREHTKILLNSVSDGDL